MGEQPWITLSLPFECRATVSGGGETEKNGFIIQKKIRSREKRMWEKASRYMMVHFLCLGVYFWRYASWFVLIAPFRFDLMSATASRGFIPASMSATATSTGALPKPATQWMPMVDGVGLWRTSFTNLSHLSIISSDGDVPSGYAMFCEFFLKFKAWAEKLTVYSRNWTMRLRCCWVKWKEEEKGNK